MSEKSEAGRKGRVSGRLFELKVRKDLEKSGWIVAKWPNNVELGKLFELNASEGLDEDGWVVAKWINKTRLANSIKTMLSPAKRKYNPFTKFTSFGNGFPDFVSYRLRTDFEGYEVIGVEVKSNGYLDKEEKAKCAWLLHHKVFSRIVVAKKGKKRGEVCYTNFEIVPEQ